ncbi:Imm10 family immunity protein [Streptomyces sp. NPDC019443]|uniref:Imm10 family immunity protein n=1 Tax=Streptomyces sp. NPDC019443 TaxID=3365061 RepID=UPI0037B7AB65
MAYRFTARAVAAEVDVDGEMQAGVAEYEDEEGFFLLFTSPIAEPSTQDISLGLDTYCVMTPDQCTAFGCVREVALTGSLLTVSLDPDCLDDLELEDAEIEAVLDMPAKSIDEMRDVLAKVLAFGRTEVRPRLTGFSV